MTAGQTTAILFTRCSSSGSLEGRQDTSRQVDDLQDYASRNYYKVEKVFQEHISGATKLAHRAILGSAISYAKEHHIHTILTTELSRLGRSDDVLYVVKECKDLDGLFKFLAQNGDLQFRRIDGGLLVAFDFHGVFPL